MLHREDNGQPRGEQDEGSGLETDAGGGGDGDGCSLLGRVLLLSETPAARDDEEEVLGSVLAS